MAYPRITGDNLNYLYNRDENTKNFASDGIFYASYGTRIKFYNRIGGVMGRDHYSNKYPVGLNSMTAEIDLLLQGLTDGEAGVLISALQEKMSEEGTGAGAITLTNSSSSAIDEDISGIYLNLEVADAIYNEISGIYVTEYNDNHRENFLHDLSISLKTNAYSPFLNYWGIYSNSSQVSTWASGQQYSQNDIVYYPVFANARDNFFYCSQDHSSTAGNAPTGNGAPWSQSFIWSPNYAVNVNSKTQQDEAYEAGFFGRVKTNKNNNKVTVDLMFNNRSNAETRAILHFLENRMGYKKFDFVLSGIYRSSKIFSAPEWEHEFVFYNSNNIKVRIDEEVSPIIGRELNATNFWNIGHE